MPSSSPYLMRTLNWMTEHGLKPVPLHYRSKAAINREYVSPDYKPPDAALWSSNAYNLGVVLGETSNCTYDGDLDSPEALFFAPRFMPATKAIFGRKGKPASHRLYSSLDAPKDFKKLAFVDPVRKEGEKETTFLELRGSEHQTVMPGSIHEGTGEEVRWADNDDLPSEITSTEWEQLLWGAQKTAIACLIARHIWEPGYHNEPCKHLSGMLFQHEWTFEEVKDLIEAIMEYSGDKDKSRIPTVRACWKRFEQGKLVTGAGKLREQLGPERAVVVDTILKWMGVESSKAFIPDYNERYAVVVVGDATKIAAFKPPLYDEYVFYSVETFMMVTKPETYVGFNAKGNQVLKSKAKGWLESDRRRYYGAVDYYPGIKQDDDRIPVDTLNLWIKWGCEPKKGDCSAWLELLRDVICGGNLEQDRWMRCWFAHILRDTMTKPGTVPVLIGKEGAGKSMLVNYFGKVLGKHYIAVTNDRHIHGNFNKHLGSRVLIHAEEAIYGGEKKHAGILRSMITDDTIIMEIKGVDSFPIKSYHRLFITTNDFKAAPAQHGDRRFTIIDMGYRKISDDLVDRMVEEQRGDGPAALYHYLLNMPDYDPDLVRKNLVTEDALDLKIDNADPIISWWKKRLDSGQLLPDELMWLSRPSTEPWPQIVLHDALYRSFIYYKRVSGYRMPVTESRFHSTLVTMLGTRPSRTQLRFRNPLSVEDEQVDLPQEFKFTETRGKCYTDFPSLDRCRQAFDKYIGQPGDWVGPSEELIKEDSRRGDKQVERPPSDGQPSRHPNRNKT